MLDVTKQHSWRDAQGLRDSRNDHNGRVPDTTLDAADIGPVQLGLESEFLLRPALLPPQPLQVEAQLPPDVHARRQGR